MEEKDSLEVARLLWHSVEEMRRREQVKELREIYTHDWRDQLRLRIQALFSPQIAEQLFLKADTSLNLLRWVADELAQIYAVKPKRRLVAKKEDPHPPSQEQCDDALRWYEGDGRLDLALDRAAKMCFALREIVIRPHVSDNCLSLEILSPENLMVIPNPHDYTKLRSILVRLDEYRFGFWEDDRFVELNASLSNPQSEANKYRTIPYLVCHASFPVASFWHEFEALALKEATISACVGLTDHAHLRHLQSFKQIYVITDKLEDTAKTMLLDPSGIIHLRGNSSCGLLDLQADLDKHLDSVLEQAGAILSLYGIRPEQLRGTLDASSGFALSIKLLGTIKAWKAQRRVWEVWEKALWEKTQRIAGACGVSLPVCDLEIEFQSILGEDFNDEDSQESENKK
jgi:hypothetical protein